MQALASEIEAVDRELIDTEFDGESGAALSLERTYPTTREYLWSVLTDPGHLNRWFLPITGDLRDGGSYAFDGNAEGDILECTEFARIRVTWVYGGGAPSVVDVELEDDGDDCLLHLLHTADAATIEALLEQIGPEGTASVGAGWDASLLQLSLYLDGHDPVPVVDADDAAPEMQAAMAAATSAWTDLFETSDWGA